MIILSLPYRLIRSSRKTLALEIRDGHLLIRAPYFMPVSEIEKLILKKEKWILSHLAASRDRSNALSGIAPLSDRELRDLSARAAAYIPGRVRHYAEIMNLHPRSVTIRKQRTRWGSCSSKGNLNFNCLLMLTPPEVIDSVVVHELSHMKEMNHSEKFYREVYRVFPDYDRWHAWLKEHQSELLARL